MKQNVLFWVFTAITLITFVCAVAMNFVTGTAATVLNWITIAGILVDFVLLVVSGVLPKRN